MKGTRCVPFFYLFISVAVDIGVNTTLRPRLLLWVGIGLFAACLLPNHYSPWLSVHQELCAALAFVPVLVYSSVRVRCVPLLAFASTALALVPLGQLVSGKLSFATDGLMATLYLVGFALAVHAGAHCTGLENQNNQPVFTTLCYPWMGLLLAAVFSVGIQLYQWLLLGDRGIYVAELPPDWRPFGNLAQPNQLASLLLFGMAGVMFFWESGKLRAGIAMAAAFLLSAGLVMSGSRSVFLALIWLVPAYVMLRRRAGLRTTPLAMAALISFYLAATFSWQPINNFMLLGSNASTAVNRMVERMGGSSAREVIWASMLDAASRAPWFGYGWGQIGSAQTVTALEYPATHSFFDSSHNLFLDIALWSGVPVAIAAAAVIVLWFAWQIYGCRDALSFAVLTAIAVLFSHAMVEFPLNYAYFLLPAGFWMGTLSAVNPSRFDAVNLGAYLPGVRAAVAVLSGVTLLLFGLVATEYFPFEEDWRLMQFQEKRIGSLEPTETPAATVLTGIHEFLRFSRTDAKPGMSTTDIDWMRRVSERYGYAAPMYKYALAQALNNQADGAQLTLRRLCRMQTESACRSARHEWNEVSRTRFPQLAPFPVIVNDVKSQ